MLSVVVVRSVQRHQEKQHHGHARPSPPSKRPSSSAPTKATAGRELLTVALHDRTRAQERRERAADSNRHLPKVEGMLQKHAQRGPLGLFGWVWHDRWFELDPEKATLRYWEPSARHGPGKRVFSLSKLIDLDTNPYHLNVLLRFGGEQSASQPERVLSLQTTSARDFRRWMRVLGEYGPSTTLERRALPISPPWSERVPP